MSWLTMDPVPRICGASIDAEPPDVISMLLRMCEGSMMLRVELST